MGQGEPYPTTSDGLSPRRDAVVEQGRDQQIHRCDLTLGASNADHPVEMTELLRQTLVVTAVRSGEILVQAHHVAVLVLAQLHDLGHHLGNDGMRLLQLRPLDHHLSELTGVNTATITGITDEKTHLGAVGNASAHTIQLGRITAVEALGPRPGILANLDGPHLMNQLGLLTHLESPVHQLGLDHGHGLVVPLVQLGQASGHVPAVGDLGADLAGHAHPRQVHIHLASGISIQPLEEERVDAVRLGGDGTERHGISSLLSGIHHVTDRSSDARRQRGVEGVGPVHESVGNAPDPRVLLLCLHHEGGIVDVEQPRGVIDPRGRRQPTDLSRIEQHSLRKRELGEIHDRHRVKVQLVERHGVHVHPFDGEFARAIGGPDDRRHVDGVLLRKGNIHVGRDGEPILVQLDAAGVRSPQLDEDELGVVILIPRPMEVERLDETTTRDHDTKALVVEHDVLEVQRKTDVGHLLQRVVGHNRTHESVGHREEHLLALQRVPHLVEGGPQPHASHVLQTLNGPVLLPAHEVGCVLLHSAFTSVGNTVVSVSSFTEEDPLGELALIKGPHQTLDQTVEITILVSFGQDGLVVDEGLIIPHRDMPHVVLEASDDGPSSSGQALLGVLTVVDHIAPDPAARDVDPIPLEQHILGDHGQLGATESPTPDAVDGLNIIAQHADESLVADDVHAVIQLDFLITLELAHVPVRVAIPVLHPAGLPGDFLEPLAELLVVVGDQTQGSETPVRLSLNLEEERVGGVGPEHSCVSLELVKSTQVRQRHVVNDHETEALVQGGEPMVQQRMVPRSRVESHQHHGLLRVRGLHRDRRVDLQALVESLNLAEVRIGNDEAHDLHAPLLVPHLLEEVVDGQRSCHVVVLLVVVELVVDDDDLLVIIIELLDTHEPSALIGLELASAQLADEHLTVAAGGGQGATILQSDRVVAVGGHDFLLLVDDFVERVRSVHRSGTEGLIRQGAAALGPHASLARVVLGVVGVTHLLSSFWFQIASWLSW